MSESAIDVRSRRERWLIGATAMLCVVLMAALLAWLFEVLVQPAPPKKVVMATGPQDGAYYSFAIRYREYLRRYGIELVLYPSNGSLENLALLAQRKDGVQVALIQGGIGSAEENPGLMTLGSVFYEPLWLFWHGKEAPDSVTQLHGKRIAIGSEGSGTRVLAQRLLQAHGISPDNSRIESAGGLDAARKLEAGEVDAAVFVNAPQAPAIRQLMFATTVQLVPARRADAYVRQFPFLNKVILPAGAIDLARDIPKSDQALIAVTANLIATDDLHPVIVDLLLEATRVVHGKGSLFDRPGEFPAIRDRAFPVSPDAERNYRGELSFLRRYLPFWLAIWIQRFAFFAIPLLALGIPLMRYLPEIYRWRVRHRIYRWYRELKTLERVVREEPDQLHKHRAQLDAMEERINEMKVPLAYASEYYTLRMHIALVRQIMESMREHDGSPA